MLLIMLGLGFSLHSLAGNPEDSLRIMEQLKRIDSIESHLHYKTGQVIIKDGLATLNLAPGYKFLNAEETRYILEDVWGNLKGQTALGMILPDSMGGLVAGKVLAKVGFFALALKYIKFILLGLVAAGGAIWRFIRGRRKEEEELVYETAPAEQEQP